MYPYLQTGLPRWPSGKEPPARAGDSGSIPGSGRFPEEKMAPTPVFLPGESHGQRSLAGYSPRGRKESDVSEYTHTVCNHVIVYIENPPQKRKFQGRYSKQTLELSSAES